MDASARPDRAQVRSYNSLPTPQTAGNGPAGIQLDISSTIRQAISRLRCDRRRIESSSRFSSSSFAKSQCGRRIRTRLRSAASPPCPSPAIRSTRPWPRPPAPDGRRSATYRRPVPTARPRSCARPPGTRAALATGRRRSCIAEHAPASSTWPHLRSLPGIEGVSSTDSSGILLRFTYRNAVADRFRPAETTCLRTLGEGN